MQRSESVQHQVLVGFDGFIDTLVFPVEKRLSRKQFKKIPTLTDLGAKIAKASNTSTNIELVTKETTIGGNAPILASALAYLGTPSILIGCCGYPQIQPIFQNLEALPIELLSFANPGTTQAIECLDGKIMLGKMGDVTDVTLKTLFARFPQTIFEAKLKEVGLIACVNWTMMPFVDQFFTFLYEHKHLLKALRGKHLFLDLADPSKRPKTDLQKCLTSITSLSAFFPITLGLNKSESEQVASRLKIRTNNSEKRAQEIAKRINIDTVLIHNRHEVAAYSQGFSTTITVPKCINPKRSTGAGDTFNAGYIHALLHEETFLTCLHTAIAASTLWVKTGKAPDNRACKAFVEDHF
jgi:sugar/nucleoside kinase (ribokinase family)